jgi:hypothetical protein
VDQVGEQGNAECARVDERLRERGQGEDGEAERDGTDAGAGAQERAIEEPVCVLVLVFMLGVRFAELNRRRPGLVWFVVVQSTVPSAARRWLTPAR